MKTKIDLVKEWFQKADNDILNIENNLKAEKIPADTVCFHAQQSVEKYLKGYLVFHDIEFEYSHDLVYLVELGIQTNDKLKDIFENVNKMNAYAVKMRYPYYRIPSLEEARESYEIAIKIRDFVLGLLKGNL